jgi:uncharacterized heparinase superfamily protein
MTPAEASDRLRQEIQKRIDSLMFGSGHFPALHEIRELHLENADDNLRATRLLFAKSFFFSKNDIPRRLELLRVRFPAQVDEIVRVADSACQHRFDLLGYKNLDYGPEIDWHLDRVHNRRAPDEPFFKINFLDFASVGDAKVTWELSRHQHFIRLAQAYRLTNNPAYATELLAQWRHWQIHNPYPRGINWASTLEVAFRSLSWLWVYFLLDGTPFLTRAVHREWLRAIALHARHIDTYLSNYFSPNTHLLGEAVALFFVGTLYPELHSALRWQQRGLRLILQESERQFRADGLHFEQSTYYHVYALDLFLHAKILATLNGAPFPPAFDTRVEKMLDALAAISHTGVPPRFGDDDGGRLFDPGRNRAEHLTDPLATGAVLFDRGDFKYLAGTLREETIWLLGADGAEAFDQLQARPPEWNSSSLPEAGLHVMASSENRLQAIIDVGPQGGLRAGHGHADALSMTVSAGGRELLIDPGTCEYVGPGTERSRFRTTAAHNTVLVDSQNQSEPDGPFAWKRLTASTNEAWINGKHFDYFVGSHDGYWSLPNPATHRRFVFFRKPCFWLVRDVIFGPAATHQIDIRWHLHPRLHPAQDMPDCYSSADGAEGIAILAPFGHACSRTVERDSCSPLYGVTEESSTVRFSAAAPLPAEFATLLLPTANLKQISRERLHFAQTSNARGTSEYQFTQHENDHTALFADGKMWNLGGWSTDAKFFYECSASGKINLLILCNFKELTFQGQQITRSPKRIPYCEFVFSDTGVEVNCPDPQLQVATERLSKRMDPSSKASQALFKADS